MLQNLNSTVIFLIHIDKSVVFTKKVENRAEISVTFREILYRLYYTDMTFESVLA